MSGINELWFKEIKAIIMLCIKEAIAGEISDEDNASSGAEEILRCGFVKKEQAALTKTERGEGWKINLYKVLLVP